MLTIRAIRVVLPDAEVNSGQTYLGVTVENPFL
jgi:hypothetical protein